MIRAHKIIRHWRTNDFHWKRSMASHSRKLAQNHVAAPQRWEENESGYGPSGQECYRGGPAHKRGFKLKVNIIQYYFQNVTDFSRSCLKFTNLMKPLQKFSIFYVTDQNMLLSQIS